MPLPPLYDDFFYYALLDGRLIGSEHPGALGHPRGIAAYFVAEHGVRALITLTEDFLDYGIPDLAQYHVPILRQAMRAQVERAVGLIGDHLAKDEAVWVHCMHGLDRTGCVLGCYLASMGQAPEQVIAGLLDRFPPRRREGPYVELWQRYADIIRSFVPPAPPAPPRVGSAPSQGA